jgi:hypothetical protein
MSFFDDDIEVVALWILAINKTLGLGQEKDNQNVCSSLTNSLLQQLPQQNTNSKNRDDLQFSQIQSQLRELENSLSTISKRIF